MILHSRIDSMLSNRSGSYIVEGAVFLPALIISVCALTLIIRIIGLCENVCFITAGKVLEADMEAYKNKFTVSLCNELEEAVREEVPGDFDVTAFRYLYRSGQAEDLILIEEKAVFTVVNVIGIDAGIEFELSLLTRGFTGERQDEKRLTEAEFLAAGRSAEVTVFPKYGRRYHDGDCFYVQEREGESGMMVMQMREAQMRGYTPCLVCGGGS